MGPPGPSDFSDWPGVGSRGLARSGPLVTVTFSTGQVLAAMAGPKWEHRGSDTFFRRVHCVLSRGARSGSAVTGRLFRLAQCDCRRELEVGQRNSQTCLTGPLWAAMAGSKWAHYAVRISTTGPRLAAMAGPKLDRRDSETFSTGPVRVPMLDQKRASWHSDFSKCSSVGYQGGSEVGPS